MVNHLQTSLSWRGRRFHLCDTWSGYNRSWTFIVDFSVIYSFIYAVCVCFRALLLCSAVQLPPLTVWQADVWAVRWEGDSAESPLLSNWLSHTGSQSWQIGFLGIHERWGWGLWGGVRPWIIWQGEGFNCRCNCVCLTFVSQALATSPPVCRSLLLLLPPSVFICSGHFIVFTYGVKMSAKSSLDCFYHIKKKGSWMYAETQAQSSTNSSQSVLSPNLFCVTGEIAVISHHFYDTNPARAQPVSG